MKTIVLAAGYATRLYPLTESFPKPLLEIGRNTILGRMLDDIDSIPEVTEHIIVTNAKFAGIFETWASNRASRGVSTAGKPVRVLSDGTCTNETRLGAVRDLILAIDTYKLDEDLLVVAADNILEFSFRGFVEAFKEKGTSMIMCHNEPEIYKLQRTGVIEVDADMRVLQMQEKPEVPVSHWAVPPFYIYKKSDLPLIKGAIEGGCGFDAPGNLAHYLVDKTVVHAWPMPAGRFDIGSLDTYEEAKRKYGN
ncbi:MAG: nucleotidyltransferase family protein [Bacteroidales bacterium]|nr:nucleotidyltransferase family protein [Bacteroidales bacterium]